ncbi:MAG: hypothetical protein HUJ42_02220 [Malacoplasma sp.]|nr:hypothetical protein [Malacoplasma sp.]
MNSSSNDKNINFKVFENYESTEDYLASEIVRHIKSKIGLNLAIESRAQFYSLFDKLKQIYNNKQVSFQNVNFFMTDDYIYDFNKWSELSNTSTEVFLKNTFFNAIDFQQQNFHSILNFDRFVNLFTNGLSSYDAEIDAVNGLDVLVLKMRADGSLIFNRVVDDTKLASQGVNLDNTSLAVIRDEFQPNTGLPVACATLGIDQILKTRMIYIIGVGSECANVLQKLFYTKDYDKKLPTCLLKNHPNVVVLVDKKASAGIFAPIDTLYTSSKEVLSYETQNAYNPINNPNLNMPSINSYFIQNQPQPAANPMQVQQTSNSYVVQNEQTLANASVAQATPINQAPALTEADVFIEEEQQVQKTQVAPANDIPTINIEITNGVDDIKINGNQAFDNAVVTKPEETKVEAPKEIKKEDDYGEFDFAAIDDFQDID